MLFFLCFMFESDNMKTRLGSDIRDPAERLQKSQKCHILWLVWNIRSKYPRAKSKRLFIRRVVLRPGRDLQKVLCTWFIRNRRRKKKAQENGSKSESTYNNQERGKPVVTQWVFPGIELQRLEIAKEARSASRARFSASEALRPLEASRTADGRWRALCEELQAKAIPGLVGNVVDEDFSKCNIKPTNGGWTLWSPQKHSATKLDL